MGTYIPAVPGEFYDNNGDPAAGYKLFSYQAGTTTKLNTYSAQDLSVANTNPIILDSAGRATIFLSAASYKFVLAPPTDTDPPSSPIWTRDNILSLAAFNVNVDVSGVAGESLSTGNCCYLSAGDGALTAGRWYKASDGNTYSSISAHAIGFPTSSVTTGQTGAFRIIGRIADLGGLTPGALQYIGHTAGTITETPPTTPPSDNPRAIAQADTATSMILSTWVPASLAKISVVTTTGTSTWTRHPDAKAVTVLAIGAGGGGGSGRRGAAGSDRFGGGGGAGANYTLATLNASILGATETVTVGAGGAGGAGVGADNTNGNNGTAGAQTSFGIWVAASGGAAGSGGTAAAGTGGASNTTQGMAFGASGGSGQNGIGSTGGFGAYYAAGGGGGGGGINAANATANGGAGGNGSVARNTVLLGGAGGVVATSNGANGTSATANEVSGGAGGGGGASGTTFMQGGDGGTYGGGGGGGGATVNGTAGLRGGNGANGICIIVQV